MKAYLIFTKYIILPITDLVLKLKISKNLNLWRSMQWLSQDDLKILQKEKLFKILLHSKKNVPYFGKIMKNIRLKNVNDSFEVLKKMPVLTKRIIKEQLQSEFIDNNRKIYQIEKTSGSSGRQGTFYLDRSSYSNTISIQSLWWEWSGYSFGDPMILFGINPKRRFIKTIKDFLFRTIYINAFDLNVILISFL